MEFIKLHSRQTPYFVVPKFSLPFSRFGKFPSFSRTRISYRSSDILNTQVDQSAPMSASKVAKTATIGGRLEANLDERSVTQSCKNSYLSVSPKISKNIF